MDPRVRARVHARRKFAVEGMGALFEDLREVLYRFNPLNLPNNGDSRDEYGSPIATLLPRISRCESLDQLQFALEDEFVKHYGDRNLLGAEWKEIAKELWKVWTQFQRSRDNVR